VIYENVFTPVTTLTKSPVATGGACKVTFFNHGDVLNWPAVDPLTGKLTAAIDLKPGASIYFLECVDKGRTFSETKKRSTAGPIYDIEVNAELAGNSPGNTLALAAMDFHNFGIIVNDRDGMQRLIGNPDSGASLDHDYNSGDIVTSRKRKLKWTWEHPTKAPIYTSSAFNITIGGTTVTAGSLTLIMRFRVGAVDAPMNDGDNLLTNAGFANKNLLVIASGILLPCDDGRGSIDWTGSIERHYEKTLASDTINFVGAVVLNEVIEIYAFTS
jgi:hypothetical protein